MRKIFLIGSISLFVGIYVGQQLPNTLLTHPVATMRLLHTLPVGSPVVPSGQSQLIRAFSDKAWGDYGVVIGYEPVTDLDGKSVLLCLVRTQVGSGQLLAVNPIWLQRADLRHAPS